MVYARKKVTKIVNFVNKKRLKFFSEHPVSAMKLVDENKTI